MTAFKVLDAVSIPRFGLEMVGVVVATDDRVTVVKLSDGNFKISGFVYRFASEQIYHEDCCGSQHRELCAGRSIDAQGYDFLISQSDWTTDPVSLFTSRVRSQYANTVDV
jgi:hypothetical protein